MAGGVGSRFWPLSTTNRPKQFLDILGTGKTLIEQTYERVNRLCPAENVFVVTNELYKDKTTALLQEIPRENILYEPARRNTAPCIAYAAYRIRKLNPEANLLVTPADHVILKEDKFVRVVQRGLDFTAENDALLTLGIKPFKAETGYGYIQADINQQIEDNKDWKLNKVKKFTEKPDLELANVFVESGDYYWNAGIFIWSLPAIIRSFEHNMPALDHLFKQHDTSIGTSKERQAIEKIYDQAESISIDYGVMEKASNVFVLSTDIGWSDVGTWSALQELSELDENGNNVNKHNTILNQTRKSIIKIHEGKIAVIDGLEDFIVVDDEKSLLICRKSNEQTIKQFVGIVKDRFGEDFI